MCCQYARAQTVTFMSDNAFVVGTIMLIKIGDVYFGLKLKGLTQYRHIQSPTPHL
jgi:hypothetical protein